jgi:hypothetical protein
MKKALFFLIPLFLLSCHTSRVPLPPEGQSGILYYDGNSKSFFWIDPKDFIQDPSPSSWDAPNPWDWVPVDTMTIFNANTGKPLYFWSHGNFYEPSGKEASSGRRIFGSKDRNN